MILGYEDLNLLCCSQPSKYGGRMDCKWRENVQTVVILIDVPHTGSDFDSGSANVSFQKYIRQLIAIIH